MTHKPEQSKRQCPLSAALLAAALLTMTIAGAFLAAAGTGAGAAWREQQEQQDQKAQQEKQEKKDQQDQPPPDASDIAEGLRLFQQKGNCQSCHGWAGDGRNTDSQMPSGANLRETKLSRAGLVLTIKCGRLNAQMPAFDKFAYTDGRCYGKTKADLKSYPTRMPDPPATLQPREIELIVDFLQAKVIGKGPMDHAKCVDFWGEETDACKEFPK
jgi:mono/diheme cytochrome c family protein